MDFKIGEPVWWMQNGVRVDGRVVRSLGGGRYEVKKNVGGTWEVDGADLNHVFDKYPINSRACNAKFKVGDVVSVKREAAEMIDNPALARKRGRVTKVLPGGYYEVDGELGATGLELTDAELTLANGVRSRNAVVAKALNACARNAGGYFVYWTPWSKKANIVAEEIIKENPRIKTKGSNLMIFESIEEAKKVYDLFRAKGVRSNDLNYDAVKNACGTARNAWGDETQVNGLITKMLGLINKIKPIAQQLYDTAFDLDDAGSVWLGQNKGSKNAQKVKIAVERANKVMTRLSSFTSGLD